jgi:hypothetical protein
LSIVVFWIQKSPSEMFPAMAEPKCRTFRDDQMMEAYAFMGEKRTEVGTSNVTMSNEPEGMVGTKDAGGAVVDGKLPDGSDYTWMKRRSQ